MVGFNQGMADNSIAVVSKNGLKMANEHRRIRTALIAAWVDDVLDGRTHQQPRPDLHAIVEFPQLLARLDILACEPLAVANARVEVGLSAGDAQNVIRP